MDPVPFGPTGALKVEEKVWGSFFLGAKRLEETSRPSLRKDSSKVSHGHPSVLYQHSELIILGPSCETRILQDDNPHSGARVLLLYS